MFLMSVRPPHLLQSLTCRDVVHTEEGWHGILLSLGQTLSEISRKRGDSMSPAQAHSSPRFLDCHSFMG